MEPAFIKIATALLLLALSGCVTQTDRVFTEPPSPEKALQQRVDLARQYIGEGNWNDAKRNLKQAERMDPHNAELNEAFALVYQRTGEYELAEEYFKKAIRGNRNFSRARNNYAVFLYSRKRYKEAAEQLEYVVSDLLYTQRAQAFINLGLSRLQLDDKTGAEEAFTRALAMERVNAVALLETAILRFEAADYETSEKYYGIYRTAVRQQSARGLWLGVQLAQQAGNRDAEGSYGMALRNLYPQSAEYLEYRSRHGDQ
ncbi:MAG: type IV pilus biogenesis/stability protein PilW [Parahaliea sp.]